MNKKSWTEIIGFQGLSLVIRPKEIKLEEISDDDTLEVEVCFHFQGQRGELRSHTFYPPNAVTPETTLMFLDVVFNMGRRQFLTGVYAILMGEDPDEKCRDSEYLEMVEHVMKRVGG